MQYNDFQGLKLSALGLGCMRFPLIDGKDEAVDMEATAAMVDYAMTNGINYFDTAWFYHGGNSETIIGELLKEYPRDSYYLADKFPGNDLNNMPKVQEIFEKQLEKCGVDYFDFYLLHNVCDRDINEYLDPQYGILDYLLEQKKNGRIRHLGFSTHGSLQTMQRFLDAWGEHMECCQIQLNWFDWVFQNGKAKVALLRERNLPIIVMEPVRGGKLATLSEPHMARLRVLQPDWSAPAWAFRFLQSVPGIITTLSGMSNMEQLTENINTYSSVQPLGDRELATLSAIADEMIAVAKIPCTNCRYCTAHCPQELDIPGLLEMYNAYLQPEEGKLPPSLSALPDDKQPAACIGCESCETFCPQNIRIAKVMADFAKIE